MPTSTPTHALPAGTIQIMPRAIEQAIAHLLKRIPDLIGLADASDSVQITRHTSGIALTVALQLRYGAPIESTAERARALLQRELPRILGTPVSEIRIAIAALRPELQ
ncbi:MAG: hypothetical protein Fur005_30540 [Roseiflexaceae bacterium]